MNTILMAMTFVAFMLTMTLRYATQSLLAALMGDGAPARDRRLSLNPVRHLSALGTCVGMVAAFPVGGGLPVGIGWGRIVRPDARKLSTGPNTGLILIGLSGIAVNLLVGIGVAVGLAFIPYSLHDQSLLASCAGLAGGQLQGCLAGWQPGWELRLEQFAFVFASVNVTVGLLNILPLYPLDGYHILYALLPTNAALAYRRGEQWQELILAALLFFLPLLLQLSGSPVVISPTGFVQSLALNIVTGFSGNHYYATLLL